MTESENLSSSVIEVTMDQEDDLAHSLQRTCAQFLNKNEFVDCTLACSDGNLQAHRVVLSAVSPYLHNVLVATPWPTPCSHPLILLKKAEVSDVRNVLNLIYTGKMVVAKKRIGDVMSICRELGCVSLGTAIKCAMKSACAVEMLQRRQRIKENKGNQQQQHYQQQNVQNGHLNSEQTIEMKNLDNVIASSSPQDSPQSSSSSCLGGESKLVLVKSEPADSLGCDDDPMSPKSTSALTVTPVSMTFTDGSGSCKKQADNNSGGTSQGNRANRFKSTSNSTTMNNNNRSSSGEYDIQLDKAESFVYTNEDLGMMAMDADNDTDNNFESGEDDVIGVNVTNIASGTNSGVKHEVSGSCPWCMQVFTSLPLLQRHMKNHMTGPHKPFACHFCNSTFSRSAHLKRHLRTHTGEKPYECQVCNRLFARQDKLKNHVEKHAQNSVKTPNNSLTITSYPPPSVSQSSGNQVPIKVLIPTGNCNNNNNGGSIQSNQNSFPNGHQKMNSNNVMSFGNIALNNLTSSSSAENGTNNNLNNGNSAVSYSSNNNNSSYSVVGPATITPIVSSANTGLLNQRKLSGKSGPHNISIS